MPEHIYTNDRLQLPNDDLAKDPAKRISDLDHFLPILQHAFGPTVV